MKKFFALTLALTMSLCLLAGCAGGGNDSAPADTAATEPAADAETEAPADTADTTEAEAPAGGDAEAPEAGAVMTHDEYVAADLESEVVVETYVQATQSWWEDTITVYAQSEDGAYFLYNMTCSEEDAAKLVPGTKIRVDGFKSEWSGEVEIIDATFEFVDDGDTFVADPADVTDLLGTDELIDHQNEKVCFKGLTVEPSTDADGNEAAFLYNWDGSGEDGNDLYFNVSKDGQTYNFCVESYLCDNTTDVYAAVKALNVGDVIDLEGYLYWYEGVNPHITSVTPAV